MAATAHHATETVAREIEETDTITRICTMKAKHKTTRITINTTMTGDTGTNTPPMDRDSTEGVQVDRGVLRKMQESPRTQ